MNDFATSPTDRIAYRIGDWSAEWWQWVLGIPQATNPQLDTTGEFCDVNQPASPFWFLAGTFGGDAARSCTIPAGKLLFFPLSAAK